MALEVVYEQPGNPADVLKVVEAKGPAGAPPGTVLVRVTAFPLHPGDLHAVEAARATGLPQRAGIEAAGVVEALGPGVSRADLHKGARVCVFPHPGAWGEYILADPDFTVAVPDDVPDDAAAQMLVNPLTITMLRRELERSSPLRDGGLFLQTAAGSSVGRLLSAEATRRGMAHINIVRSPEGARQLKRRLPDTPVLTTADPDWQEQARKIADGRPIGAAADPVGGPLAGQVLRMLSSGGTLIAYGQLDPRPVSLHSGQLLSDGLGLRGVAVTRWVATTSPEQRRRDVRSAVELTRAHLRHMETPAHYDIADLRKAVDHAQRPGKVGTVLVTIG
ncbi:alcohol dehydrogenase catalytic domain-containing protein [Streptomyces sp. NPDC093675]|uniref:alcohol dehydrogenase catalytic domain-containing protein n=1 Tax=Streptomyces sp. NPDC093675 TaxID=3366049 RepID=UPI00380ECF95